MSVHTTADEKLDIVKESVDCAILNISEMVINKCWGWENYTKEYQTNLRNVMNQLLDIRDNL